MRLKRITVLALCFLLTAVFQQATLAQDAAPVQTITLASRGFTAKLSPDGKTLVTFDNILILNLKDFDPAFLPMHVIDVSTGKEISQLSGYTDYVNDVAFSSRGKQMVSLHMNGDLNIWDTTTWKITKTYQTPLLGQYLPVNFFPDNLHIMLLSPSTPPRLLVFDLQTGAITQGIGKHFDNLITLQAGLSDYAARMDLDLAAYTLSADGKWAATSTQNDEVGLWSVADNSYQVLRKKSDQPGLFSIRQMSFTPDGTSLVYFDSSDSRTHIWDVASATEKTSLAIGSDSFTLSPDGTKFAWLTRVKDGPNTVSVASLDAPDKAQVVFTLPDGLTVGPRMSFVYFTPDGKQLVMGGFFSDDPEKNQIFVLNVPS